METYKGITMLKILFLVPFYYLWNGYANVKSNYDFLIKHGYSVDLFSKKEFHGNYNDYDLIMLMGAGTKITKEEFDSINVPVFAFGFSDPNLFSEDHYINCDKYFTNDMYTFKYYDGQEKGVYFYNTTCDKRFHKNLGLEKETDILVYGQGSHKFVTDRNETINKLRNDGFKIRVFGRGWNIHPDTHKFIEGHQLIEEINKAHIVLDLSNKTTSWPHRIMEASGCCTPVITIYREDTALLFEETKEIVFYENETELALYLSMMLKNKVATRDMGLCAQKRCYKENDISVRIKELVKIIEEI